MEIKTTMATCPNGHHYDAARHASCPYCASPSAFSSTAPLGGSAAGGFPPTAPVGGSAPGGFPPTAPVSGSAPGGFPPTAPTTSGPNVGNINPFSVETVIGGMEGAPAGLPDPVVGWLVCVKGPSLGMDFRVHAGYNYIGREVGDIRIPGDTRISRQNHAMIAYDGGENIFVLAPAAGRNLIKVNGKTVLGTVEVHHSDVIAIGETKLLFIPLCGEKFSWSNPEGSHD